jgi:hypothetical protein
MEQNMFNKILTVFLIRQFLLGSWMNTTMIENRTILDGSELDDFDKVTVLTFFQMLFCVQYVTHTNQLIF